MSSSSVVEMLRAVLNEIEHSQSSIIIMDEEDAQHSNCLGTTKLLLKDILTQIEIYDKH